MVTYIYIIVNLIRIFPHLLFFVFHPRRSLIRADLRRFCEIYKRDYHEFLGVCFFLLKIKEFRNIFYYRIGRRNSFFINWLCPQIDTLFISTPDIGPGFFIQHGFATYIAAKKIGKNVFINQCVTIGFSDAYNQPEIGDNVRVGVGAKIIGGVCVGNNCIVGANAVVVKNVPDNCTVVGVPAYIIRRDGKSIRENL